MICRPKNLSLGHEGSAIGDVDISIWVYRNAGGKRQRIVGKRGAHVRRSESNFHQIATAEIRTSDQFRSVKATVRAKRTAIDRPQARGLHGGDMQNLVHAVGIRLA